MANRQIFQHEEDILLNDECKLLEDDANNKTKMYKLETLKNFIAEFVKDKIKSWEYDSLKTKGKNIIESANEIYDTTQKRMVSLEEIDLVTVEGFFVDALAVKELNRNFANVLGILTNIKGIYVGSKIAACNQAYALLHDTASLTKILGKAPTASNFICMVMNGDANAAQTSYYSPRYYSGDGLYVYVYPNVTGSIRINYVIFAIE